MCFLLEDVLSVRELRFPAEYWDLPVVVCGKSQSWRQKYVLDRYRMRVVVCEGKCAGRVIEVCGAVSASSAAKVRCRTVAGSRLGERAGQPIGNADRRDRPNLGVPDTDATNVRSW